VEWVGSCSHGVKKTKLFPCGLGLIPPPSSSNTAIMVTSCNSLSLSLFRVASSTGGIAFISERGGGSGAIVYDSIKRRREDREDHAILYSSRSCTGVGWGCTVERS
jgi:hypothetical protein